MKRIKLILTLVASLFAASIQQVNAQLETIPDFMILTNLAGADTYSNVPVGTISIDCSKQQNIAIEWTLWHSGASVTNCGLHFVGIPIAGTRASSPSLADGFFMTRLSGSTTNIVVTTNFNTKGYSRLDLLYATNGSVSQYLTNRIRYWVKRNAP